jgi:hypothetical protein
MPRVVNPGEKAKKRVFAKKIENPWKPGVGSWGIERV